MKRNEGAGSGNPLRQRFKRHNGYQSRRILFSNTLLCPRSFQYNTDPNYQTKTFTLLINKVTLRTKNETVLILPLLSLPQRPSKLTKTLGLLCSIGFTHILGIRFPSWDIVYNFLTIWPLLTKMAFDVHQNVEPSCTKYCTPTYQDWDLDIVFTR